MVLSGGEELPLPAHRLGGCCHLHKQLPTLHLIPRSSHRVRIDRYVHESGLSEAPRLPGCNRWFSVGKSIHFRDSEAKAYYYIAGLLE